MPRARSSSASAAFGGGLALGLSLALGISGPALAAEISYAERTKLLGSQVGNQDWFGHDVDVGGDTVIVGVWYQAPYGAAYIYERDADGIWVETIRLEAPDGGPDHEGFGRSVAISGDWILVGANEDDDVAQHAGAAYLGHRNAGGGGTWGVVQKLLPSDGALRTNFGDSVALSGNTAAIGAEDGDSDSGAVYVFERDVEGSGDWQEIAKLKAPDSPRNGHFFGSSVDIDGDRLVAGAWGDDDLGGSAGAAYVFERDLGGPNNWGLARKLLASDGAQGDYFGGLVTIDGETVATGAEDHDTGGELSRGAAYVFERDFGGPGNWGEIAKLTAIDGSRSDQFGSAVALDGDRLAIGARLDGDRGLNSGSVYVFERNEGGPGAWGKIAKLIASDGRTEARFGHPLAFAGGRLAISAPHDDDIGFQTGAVYVFDEIEIDPTLAVTGTCPGDATFDFRDGTPLGQAALAFSRNEGSGEIPGGLCAGTETGLEVVNLLGILPIDAAGEVTLDATLPFFVCDLKLQVVDLVSCATSNVTTPP